MRHVLMVCRARGRMSASRWIIGLCVLVAGPVATVLAGRTGGLMDISADGKLLACANRDSGTVTVVDLDSHQRLREVAVGRHPEGLTFVGGTYTLAVAVYDEDRVVFVEADTGATAGATEVFDEPYGVVSDGAGAKVYVTLEYPGQVDELDVATRTLARTFEAGQFPRGIALTRNDRRLLVTEYYTGIVRAIDVASGEEVDRWDAASTDNLARQITLHPTRAKAYVPHIRSRVTAAHGEGSIFPYVGVIDTERGKGDAESRRKRIPMDAFRANFVVANPWEADVSPDGNRLYVVFSGTDDLFVCDIIDDDYRELEYRRHLRLGHNPRAVRVSPSGERFYVYNALDFNLVAYDAERLEPVATIAVCENPLDEEVLAGKILFYSALQPMVGRRWISCSSCHPDGAPDGRTWNNPEGLRATPSLAGLAWTHPEHWSADRDETQDFEHTIRGPLMQGRGLIEGPVNASLDAPNKGRSERLDALAAYTNSHPFTLSPHGRGGLSDAAVRGRELFLSKESRCSECHPPPLYTDSRPGPEIVRHDVGTGGDDPGEKMGPAYDTPTLLGVYRTAPYLHHGKAAALRDVLTTSNPEDRHGRTSHLTKSQIADLVEFLKALPFEDPEPRARELGLRKIER